MKKTIRLIMIVSLVFTLDTGAYSYYNINAMTTEESITEIEDTTLENNNNEEQEEILLEENTQDNVEDPVIEEQVVTPGESKTSRAVGDTFANTFPDPIFAQELANSLAGGDVNAILTQQMINSYTTISVSNAGVRSIEGVGVFVNATQLMATNNLLTSVPDEIGQLTNLTGVWLNNNDIVELPESFGNLTKITRLYLPGNELSSLPNSFANLTKVEDLTLHENKFTQVPSVVTSLTTLQYLNLSNNQLVKLPDDLGNLVNLTRFEIASNQIPSLPNSFQNLTKLNRVDMSNNLLPSGYGSALNSLGMGMYFNSQTQRQLVLISGQPTPVITYYDDYTKVDLRTYVKLSDGSDVYAHNDLIFDLPNYYGEVFTDGVANIDDSIFVHIRIPATGLFPNGDRAATSTKQLLSIRIPRYNLSFDLNGGEGTTPTTQVVAFGSFGKTVTNPVRTGYDFIEWNTEPDGTGTVWNIKTTAMVANDATIYAQWRESSYNITYNLDGGVNDTNNPTSYTYNTGVTSFNDATKEGYGFLGWYDASTGGNQVTSISSTATGNKTLYARWEASSYDIIYNLDGGRNSVFNPSTYEYNSGINSFKDATKNGYRFLGWYDAAVGGNRVTNISTTKVGDVTLYARWEEEVYNISYNLDGGVNSATNPTTYTYNTGINSFEDATKEGYSFLGWYTALYGGNQVTSISPTTIGNQTLYARWEEASYDITYELDGGRNSVFNPSTYEYNTGVESFKDATKNGYRFLGWYDAAVGGNRVTNISTTKAGDVTLYARWEEEVYNISYNLDGGVNSASNPTTYTYNTGINSFEDATKEGYSFLGWYTALYGGNQVTSISSTSIGNQTLYARWEEATYDITYELDGGRNSVFNPSTYTYNTGVESFKDATKNGYRFLGWYDAAVGGNRVTNISSTTTGNQILYARWEEEVYNISYNLDGGVNSATNPTTYTYNTGINSFDDATKEGYSFLGWYTALYGGNQVTSISPTSIGNQTLYARWEEATYDITYELEGGRNSVFNPSTYEYNTGVESFKDATKNGYRFLGWYDAAVGGNRVTNISSTTTGNQTLYARWEEEEYNISYNLDGGVNSATNPTTYTYNTGINSFEDATKEGYSFLGWYTALYGGNQVTSISSTSIGNQTLYARWEEATYDITYELDGGVNASSNPTIYTYNTGINSFDDATKTGFNFLGWYDAAVGGNRVTSISSTTTGNQTLYARWEEISFNITYNLDGGKNASSNPITYTYNDGVTSFGLATKTGYNFLGWYDAAVDGNQVTNVAKSSTGDVELYARWEAATYDITYNLNGGVNSASNPTTYTYNIGVSVLENPTKEGFVFIGWFSNTRSANLITSISPTSTGNVVLTAAWAGIEHNIEYVLDGGVNSLTNPSNYTSGVGVEAFDVPVKEGYTFVGWFDAAVGGNQVLSILDSEIGDKVLFARWEKSVQTISISENNLPQTGMDGLVIIMSLFTMLVLIIIRKTKKVSK